MHTLSTLPYDIHHKTLSHLTTVTVRRPITEPTWSTGSNHPYLALSLVSRSLHASVEAYCQHLRAVRFPTEKRSKSTHRTTYLLNMSNSCHYCGTATKCAEDDLALPCCTLCLYERFPDQIFLEDLEIVMRMLEFARSGVLGRAG
jgi:hypothetical protein